MSSLPTAEIFAANFADHHFYMAIAIGGLAALVRGFSGFGSALIYLPLMSAVYGPRIAAVTFVMQDIVCGFLAVSNTWRRANWREVLPIAGCAVFAAQFGALILQYADPVALRWGVCALVALVVCVLASGWRYHGKPKLFITIGVGLLAGLMGGAVQISGPPIIVYWLGSGNATDVLRANFFAYFSIFSIASFVTYIIHGLVTAQMIALAIFIAPTSLTGMWLGSKLFGYASERVYRTTAYIIVALSAVIGLPIWDAYTR